MNLNIGDVWLFPDRTLYYGIIMPWRYFSDEATATNLEIHSLKYCL